MAKMANGRRRNVSAIQCQPAAANGETRRKRPKRRISYISAAMANVAAQLAAAWRRGQLWRINNGNVAIWHGYHQS